MDGQGQVPTPRRSALSWRHGSPQPQELEVGPRVPDLSALLEDIDSLRLTLQTDLTLAAAAVEAGATELAGELVDGDLAEVRAFSTGAVERLTAMDAADDIEHDVEGDVEVAAHPLPRRRILSAAPLMAAAAALIGFIAFVPERGTPPAPETTMTSAALAGFELSRLAESGAPDEALALAAEELNDELAELIAQAATDPAAAQQALMLLERTSQVLASQGNSGVLRGVIAETQLLRAKLRDALPAVPQRPARKVTSAVPVPLVEEQPEKARETSPKPASSPKPSPKPSPSEKASAEPSPTASPDRSEEPDNDGDGPLPQPGDQPDSLPGW